MPYLFVMVYEPRLVHLILLVRLYRGQKTAKIIAPQKMCVVRVLLPPSRLAARIAMLVCCYCRYQSVLHAKMAIIMIVQTIFCDKVVPGA